ncbi:SprT-like domain-containing protein (plasmid) [Bacteroides fragilis]|nr:SprT-like domain-containing protein [Bacteroides fragilis]
MVSSLRERWKGENVEKKIIHEISINPDFMDRPDKDWHSTLVHEMCHLWQEDFGKPSRNNYHNNKQWATKMIEIGLMPSDFGEPGGKTTGQQMTHYT